MFIKESAINRHINITGHSMVHRGIKYRSTVHVAKIIFLTHFYITFYVKSTWVVGEGTRPWILWECEAGKEQIEKITELAE